MAHATPQVERSDGLIICLVGFAHLMSHFYQIALAPLFPLIKAEFDVSYTALGLLVTVLYGTSGICQSFAGILVDRYGGDRLMLFGVTTMATCVFLMGLVPSYWMLLPLVMIAAVGNSVFHPADLSILSAKINPGRMGRAYAVHGFAGSCGYVLSPIVVLYGVANVAGWRVALMTAGGIGLFAAALIFRYRAVLRIPAGSPETTAIPGARFYLGLILSRPLMAAFTYFALVSAAMIGIQSFSSTAFIEIYDAPLALATAGMTAYLGSAAVGNLVGGELADRYQRHAMIAGVGLFVCAVSMAGVGLVALPMAINILLFGCVGFFSGVTHASRDILVRAAAPEGATGKVFGFVYSGLDLGGALAPLLFGWLMDGGQYRGVLLAGAIMYLLCVVSVMLLRGGRVGMAAADN